MKIYKTLQTDRRSRFGGEPPWREAETRSIDGQPVLCVRGYHGSEDLADLSDGYLYGPIVLVGDLTGQIDSSPKLSDSKVCGETLTVETIADASKDLRLFVCDLVDDLVSSEIEVPGVLRDLLRDASATARAYVEGGANDEDLRRALVTMGKSLHAIWAHSIFSRTHALVDPLVASHMAAEEMTAIYVSQREIPIRGRVGRRSSFVGTRLRHHLSNAIARREKEKETCTQLRIT